MAYNEALAVTPSDSVNLTRIPDALVVGASGVVQAVLQNNQIVAVTMTAGYPLPLLVKRINATGTTATGITALYST